MAPDELAAVRETIAALTDRAVSAERRVAVAEHDNAQLRALLTRLRTTLAEQTGLSE